ncbi:MAG: hypothetical protein JAZ15_14615 [Candidatus Thiodiazotropha endolucinida]|nr:hypothetical protein [Candidatus Thiodiazotropha taylori]MCG8052436.1 hypothetical protein [Candidatus Thiodiazotropha taylori]MCW4314258.1 hypothetical protein [Candidatus Thiodiazotropha taylori]MCW4322696.1 hypothetical protein [Candidatus Thiodiazotropha taylori]
MTRYLEILKYRCPFIALLVIVTAQLILTACSDSTAKKKEKKNFIRKGGEYHFILSGESASVPAVYLKGSSEDYLGVLRYVKLWALLPDLEAYDKTKNHYDFHPKKGFGKVVNFKLISRSERPAKINEIIRTKVDDLKTTPLSGRLGKYDEYQNDLEIYRSKTYKDDAYLYRNNDKIGSYIRCSSKAQHIPYPSCKMLWDVSDHIAAEAVFSMDYIKDWKSMLTNINGLIHIN